MERIPVYAKVDLLVVGAGLPGVALAGRCARQGKSVLLAERRIYPGFEIGGWLRPWLPEAATNHQGLAEWLGVKAYPGVETPLLLDEYKLHMENTLLHCGVQTLYAVQPVAMQPGPNGWQVLLAAKSGLYRVLAGQVADCTDTALLRRLGNVPGAAFAYGTPGASTCTIEVEGCSFAGHSVPLPGHGLWGDAVRLHNSAFAKENRLLELCFTGDGDAADGLALRNRALAAYKQLLPLPGFAEARFGAISPAAMPLREYDPGAALALGEKLAEALAAGSSYVEACPAGAANAAAQPGQPPVWPGTLHYGKGVKASDLPLAGLQPLKAAVAVCGAGPCGAAAATAAAGEGADTIACDLNEIPGGAGTAGGVHYYWYGHRRGFTRDIDDEYMQLAAELSYPQPVYVWGERDGWNPDLKAIVLWRRLARAGVRFLPGSFACGAFVNAGRVTGVLLATPHGPRLVQAAVTVDATGDADLAVLAGAEAVEGSEKDSMVMWSSMAQYKQAGMYRGGIFTTTVDVADIRDYTRFALLNRRRGNKGAYDHGSYITPRESRHLVAEYVVTTRDVVTDKGYDDTILTAFSNFDTKGKSWADLVYSGFLPGQLEIDLPYRAALAPGLEGLLVGGRAIGATHDASSGIRMQDDMQNLGGALGLAAAMAAKAGSVRGVSIPALQQLLLEKGALDATRLHRAPPPPPSYARLIDGLAGDEPWETIDMDMAEVTRDISPIVQLCLAPAEEVIPLLQRAHQAAGGQKRLLLARLLLWHRDETGIEDIYAEINRLLGSEGLPERQGTTKFCQPYPDHGVMAEASYLVCLLARGKDARAADLALETATRIAGCERDYLSRIQCVFGYMECILYLACRRPGQDMLPALHLLAALPEIQAARPLAGGEWDVDICEERIAYLKILLAEALARCGDAGGLAVLQLYSQDSRHVLARCAQRLLRQLQNAKAPAPYTKEIW